MANFSQDLETEKAMQELCRNAMMERLMHDVLVDLHVCKLHGWDWRAYPLMIKTFVDGVLENGKGK